MATGLTGAASRTLVGAAWAATRSGRRWSCRFGPPAWRAALLLGDIEEDGPHHGLTVLDELGGELSGEEGLLQNARDDREPKQAPCVLVVLEDLGQARVADA
jgi:hypothetical protein